MESLAVIAGLFVLMFVVVFIGGTKKPGPPDPQAPPPEPKKRKRFSWTDDG